MKEAINGRRVWAKVVGPGDGIEFDFMDHVLPCYWLSLICDVMCLDWPICCICVCVCGVTYFLDCFFYLALLFLVLGPRFPFFRVTTVKESRLMDKRL